MQFLSKLGMVAGAMVAAVLTNASSIAGTIIFGSGAHTFNMEFVTIGNPGNAADTTGAPSPAGAVAYEYGIGKFEVSEDMINKYNALNPSLQISKITRNTAKPATNVSWNEAARFVNWLNTSSGGFAAYKFTTGGVNDNIALWQPDDAGYDSSNPYRNSLAEYVLPSYNEWYKAAYYGPGGTYHDFANGSNTAPTAVASGETPNTAVYGGSSITTIPADVNLAGGLSPFGVMGLDGNVQEWEESSGDLLNNDGAAPRGWRGGSWLSALSDGMSSSRRYDEFEPVYESFDLGFRVVRLSSSPPPPAVPEPTSLAIFGLGALGFAYRARQKKGYWP
jgi:hypothetical protein